MSRDDLQYSHSLNVGDNRYTTPFRDSATLEVSCGKLFIAGGCDGDSPDDAPRVTKTVEMYDSESDSWMLREPTP